MELLKVIALGLWLYVAASLAGCGGMEIGGKLGVYRVDNHEDTQVTRTVQTKPMKCWFVSCPDANYQPQGS